jgi:pilus assembly protein CpaB
MGQINKKLLLIAIVFSLVTTMLLYFYMSRPVQNVEKINYTYVYIAATTIPPFNLVKENDISRVKTISSSVNKNAILDINKIIGMRTKESIIEGEQFLSNRLTDGKSLKLSLNVKKGMRAISIFVNEQVEVADFIKPGDNVDLLVSFEKEEGETSGSKIIYKRLSKLVLQNLKVLAVGQIDNYDPNTVNLNGNSSKEPPKSVTLEVPAHKSEEFVYATTYGMVRLALRGDEDNVLLPSNGSVREDFSTSKSFVKN